MFLVQIQGLKKYNIPKRPIHQLPVHVFFNLLEKYSLIMVYRQQILQTNIKQKRGLLIYKINNKIREQITAIIAIIKKIKQHLIN